LKTVLVVVALLLVATARAENIEPDKQLHFEVSWGLSLLTYTAMQSNGESKKRSYWSAVGFTLLVGVVKELHDAGEPNNKFDKNDLAADTLGALTGPLLVLEF
jgi:uncharacterized protein YfiM (DUF2279 family)